MPARTGKAVLEVLTRVVDRWGRPNRVLTDRGAQFTHWRGRTAFQRYVEDELKSEHILARAKQPQTIGKEERFHQSLKTEGLDPAGYGATRSLQQARRLPRSGPAEAGMLSRRLPCTEGSSLIEENSIHSAGPGDDEAGGCDGERPTDTRD